LFHDPRTLAGNRVVAGSASRRAVASWCAAASIATAAGIVSFSAPSHLYVHGVATAQAAQNAGHTELMAAPLQEIERRPPLDINRCPLFML
jgi:hypothetical protein